MLKKIALSQICSPKESPENIKNLLESVLPFVQGVFVTFTYQESKKEINHKIVKTYNEVCAKFGIPFFPSYGTFSTKIKKDNISEFEKRWNWKPSFEEGDFIFDFSKARNYGLTQIPRDEFWAYIWLDTDDTIVGAENLDKIVERMEKTGVNAVYFNYLYLCDFDDKGRILSVKIEHLRERLVRNDGNFRWIGPLHETLIHQREAPNADDPAIEVIHHTDEDRIAKALDRNLKTLEWCMIQPEYRDDARYFISLAKSYFDLGKHDYAEPLFRTYLEKSGWREERSQAWDYIARIHLARRDYDNAINACSRSQMENPRNPNSYLTAGTAYLYKREFEFAKQMLDCALTAPVGKSTLVSNPKDLEIKALEILFQWALFSGNIEEAENAAIKMYQLVPQSKELADRIQLVNDLKIEREINRSVFTLINYYRETGDKHRAKIFVSALPHISLNNPKIQAWKNEIIPPRKWKENEIAIFCGPGFEPWSPKNLDKGIGGSEEAVIYLSRELTKLGWEVTVFGDPDIEAGDYEGVHYRPYFEVNWDDELNILVAWRNVGIVQIQPLTKGTYIWLHDVQVDQEYTKERLDRVTKVIPLSNYHRSFIPSVPDEKVMVSSNGVELPKEHKEVARSPHAMFYGSSYDRGLEHLLNMWPEIRKEVPDATLDICYGWNLFLSFYRNNPERMAWHKKMEELMKQEGIANHGRVGHPELEEIMLGCGVLAYPTHFSEISFITGMRAQMLGCIPVTIDGFALSETIQHGIKIKGDIYDQETKDLYLKELVSLLEDEKRQEEIRTPMMGWAKEQFGWGKVADSWDREFKNRIGGVA